MADADVAPHPHLAELTDEREYVGLDDREVVVGLPGRAKEPGEATGVERSRGIEPVLYGGAVADDRLTQKAPKLIGRRGSGGRCLHAAVDRALYQT